MPKYNKMKKSDEPFIQVQCGCGLYTFEKPRLDYIFGSVFSIIAPEHIYPQEKEVGTVCIFKSENEWNTMIIGVVCNMKKQVKNLKNDGLILLYYYPCKNVKRLRGILPVALKHFKINNFTYSGKLYKMVSIVEENLMIVDNIKEDKLIKYEPKVSLKRIDYCKSCKRMVIKHLVNKENMKDKNMKDKDQDLCTYKNVPNY